MSACMYVVLFSRCGFFLVFPFWGVVVVFVLVKSVVLESRAVCRIGLILIRRCKSVFVFVPICLQREIKFGIGTVAVSD